MLRVTDVVRHLLIINVLMFLGTQLLGEPSPEEMFDLINERTVDFNAWKRLMLAMFFPGSEYFRPFQIVTHMFMHDGFMHLFFNMFALYMFGPPIEAMWGSRRFLFYYLFVGFGAAALHLFVTYLEIQYGGVSPYRFNVPMLGASGAVFGLLAAFGMLFPNNVLQLLFPPIALKAKYFVLIYAGLELFMGLSRFNSGVAHFAHLGGALFGFLLILYWKKFGSKL
ncbi:MAG: rhomboid family intramembrane serine protease [Saprospiraceae bacterium]|nr:rhomboid family intramembrane serine protease [Saprospiraceae bacterium]